MKGNYQSNVTHWEEAMQGCNLGCSGVACGELTQKARHALGFTSSPHLGRGDIPATFFPPPLPCNAGLKLGLDDFRTIFQLKQFHYFFWFIQPSQATFGDIPLGKSPSGSHPPWLWAYSSSPTISSAISSIKPTYPSASCTERYFGFSAANLVFLPGSWVGWRVHAPGWPLQAEGEQGGWIFTAQTSRHDICQEDPGKKHWASCQHVCQGSALFHIYK